MPTALAAFGRKRWRWGRVLLSLGIGGAVGALIALSLSKSPEGGPGWRSLLALALGFALVVLMPLNGWVTHLAMRDPAKRAHLGERTSVYVSTALLWIALGALSLLACAEPAWWPAAIAPLDAAWNGKVWAALAAGIVLTLAASLWARDVGKDGPKRTALMELYSRGTDLIAPRRRGELWTFRLSVIPSSAGEELAYRLLLFSLLQMWIGPLGALIVSTLAFAAAHLYQGWRASAVVAGFGALAGGLTWASGSIWPAILFHMAWNQMAASVLYAIYRED